MLDIKNLVLAAVVSCWLPMASWSADTDESDIRASFTSFWTATKSGDYQSAAAFVHPRDLAELRTELLPVLLEASTSQDQQVRESMEMFFEAVPAGQRSELSGLEIYVRMQKLAISYGEPGGVEVIKLFNPKIMGIKRNTPDEAVLRYRISVRGKAAQALQRVGKVEGRWYVHIPEPAAVTAAKFRSALAG